MARISTIDKEVILDRIVAAHRSLSGSHHHVVSLTIRSDEAVYITIAKPATKGVNRRQISFADIASNANNPLILVGHHMIEELDEVKVDKKS